jgi:hypothetical protein
MTSSSQPAIGGQYATRRTLPDRRAATTDTPDGRTGAATMAGQPGRSHCVGKHCQALILTEEAA